MSNEKGIQYKVLQFCNKSPFPQKDGGTIAINNLSNSFLSEGFELKILSVNSDKHFVDTSKLPKEYIDNTSFEAVKVDLSVKIHAALFNLIYTGRSYNISRFYNRKMASKLREILTSNTFDIILMESIFLKDYLNIIKKYSKAKIILRAHNIEFIIWQRLAKNESKGLKKFYLNILASRLKKEELQSFNKFDGILTVTENDKMLLNGLGVKTPTDVLPIGIDVNKNIDTSASETEHPSLFHLGALDWLPNQEAVKWLLKNVWPKLHDTYPNLKFYIAGRRPPQWLLDIIIPGVEIVGEVEDAADFIKSKSIMPVPIFSGSGMRVKIIEAMMLKKAIISTSIGIEGIIHEDKKDVLIANNAQEFIDSISKVIENKELYNSLCQNAYSTVNQHYSKEVLDKKLSSFVLKILNN